MHGLVQQQDRGTIDGVTLVHEVLLLKGPGEAERHGMVSLL